MASSTMTTMTTTLLFSIILFSHIAHGGPFCRIPAAVRSSYTGRVVKGKPEWKVVIYNPCVCNYIDNLTLTPEPPNFEPAVPIDPSILRKENDYWIVKNGSRLRLTRSFSFTYVGDAVRFKARQTVHCF